MEQPLAGRTVVITRKTSPADDLTERLESYGANVISCPTIEITEPESYELVDEAIEHLYGYDWVIFTSANGVSYFVRRLIHNGKTTSDLDELKVCAIGKATADKLHDAHIHVDLVPAESNAEGVFTSLVNFAGGGERLKGVNFLLPRAAVARDYLPRKLEEAGARIDAVPTYRTVVPEDVDRGRLSAMLAGSADCIVFTSSSAVKNLASLFDTFDLGNTLAELTVACIGDITANTANEYGLKVEIKPAESTMAALALAVADYYRE